MKYIFDTSTLSVILKHYFQGRFLSFWEKFDNYAMSGKILSVREVHHELKERFGENEIKVLLKTNANFFADPMMSELEFITQIYAVPHFQQNLEKKKLLKGGPFADPFLIAKAKKSESAILVTEEEYKKNGAKIPNICEHFNIECKNLEGFLTIEDWKF